MASCPHLLRSASTASIGPPLSRMALPACPPPFRMPPLPSMPSLAPAALDLVQSANPTLHDDYVDIIFAFHLAENIQQLDDVIPTGAASGEGAHRGKRRG